MRQLCLAAGLLTFFVVAVYVAAGHTAIFMPGPLSGTHKWIGRKCPACHRPFDVLRGGAARCVSDACHANVRLEKAHPPEKQPACSRCHVEHAVPALASTVAPTDAVCRGCHQAKLKKDHPIGPACHKCHFYHVGPRGMIRQAAESSAIPFKHNVHLPSMAEILKTQDRETLCRICHVVREGLHRFAPFTRQGCNRNNVNCHAVKPPAGHKKWKDPLAEKEIKNFARPEKVVDVLFMHSKHVPRYKCLDCHPDIEQSKRVTHAPIAKASLCVRCHKPGGEAVAGK